MTHMTDSPVITVYARARTRVNSSYGMMRHMRHRNELALLALDLGTTTGWALRTGDGRITSGTLTFKPSRFEGGGMRYLRFCRWLAEITDLAGGLGRIVFEEVRSHAGTDAAHIYGGFLGQLTAWCEERAVPYEGVPVGTIKRHATGRGNADKQAVLAAVTARGYRPADDNEADALALLLWAIETTEGAR
jgi:Holliday junction resolvasome RuvABC endonuclease subunit